MAYYLRHVYERYPRVAPVPDDFVGPFPDEDIAMKHRLLYGPIKAEIVKLDEPPDPVHLLSPGQQVDEVLKRA